MTWAQFWFGRMLVYSSELICSMTLCPIRILYRILNGHHSNSISQSHFQWRFESTAQIRKAYDFCQIAVRANALGQSWSTRQSKNVSFSTNHTRTFSCFEVSQTYIRSSKHIFSFLSLKPWLYPMNHELWWNMRNIRLMTDLNGHSNWC